MCTGRGKGRKVRGGQRTRLVDGPAESVSHAGENCGGRGPERRMELLGEAPNEVEGLGVGGDALRRCAGRRAGRSCGCARRSAPPMAGRVSPVCSRARYMATCRGQARRAARLVERSSSRLRPKASAVMLLDGLDGERGGRPPRGADGVEVGEDLCREGGGQRAPGERGVGDDADERALERADAVGRAVGEEGQDAVVGQADAVVLGALAQDGDARGEVGRLDGGDQAGLEALAQAVLEGAEVAREAIGGQHELAAEVVQRVEGVEELLLGLGLGGEELDVVDEQDVGVAVAALEAVHVAALQGGEELVGERLDRRVADAEAAAVGEDVVADRVQQVGLADAGRPVDEERVVGVRRGARPPPARRRGRSGWRRR